MTATSTALEKTEGANAPAPMMAAEWDMIQQQAAILASTEVVPKQFREKPNDIIAAGLMGRELGFGLTTSLRLIDVIEGNPELNAEGKIALIRSRGHSISGEVTPEGATIVGRRGDNGDTMTVTFTWEEAKAITVESWTGPKGNRTKKLTPLTDKMNWQNYRQDMLWARCVSRIGRRLFSDVLQGFSYSAEEIESFTNTEAAELPEPATVTPMVRKAPTVTPESQQPAPETDNGPENVIDAEVIEDKPEPQPEVEDRITSPAQHRFIQRLMTKAGIEDPKAQAEKLGEILETDAVKLDPDNPTLTASQFLKVSNTLQGR